MSEEDLLEEEEDIIVQAATTAVIGAALAVIDYSQTYFKFNKTSYHDSAIMTLAESFATLASGWAPESAYGEPTSPNYAHEIETSSPPQRSSSRDEYNPSHDNAPPLVSAISSASDVHTTPSHRYSSAAVSRNTRDALHTFYERIYGHDSKRCLVTQQKESLVIAHIVQRTSSPDQLSLYEYCLGCDLQTFHVDSRRNLAYLGASWRTSFDADKWLLLPDLSTLQEVESFVQSVLTARRNGSAPIETFLSKWNMDLKTTYTLMPLPRIAHEPIFRRVLNPSETWEQFSYPFNSLPSLECHVSPPLAVINGGPKLADLDLDAISLMYHRQGSKETQITTKERLTLLCSIWGLFMGVKDLAKEWENEKRGKKRKRDQDDDDIGRLSQRTDRTTRPTIRKRDRETMRSSTTLTGDVLAQLGNRQKTVDRIKEWVDSTSRRLPK
ncbi:hypothetical protein F5888DRAFT_1800012 [Russula emetica]|nr:hypothetical protein F5888DRAFT_1800012 [Russula emetica]